MTRLMPKTNYLSPKNDTPMITPTSLRDKDDETSLLHYLTPEMQAAIHRIPDDIFNLSEKELHKRMEPDALLCRLRLSFWDEYQRIMVQGGAIDMTQVCHGNCTREYFYKKILLDPLQLMWIITPPQDYYLSMREMLDQGLQQLRKIIMQPFVVDKVVKVKDADGNLHDKIVQIVDTRVMAEIRAAVTMVDQRVKGAIVQRMQVTQKNLNMNLEGAPALHAAGFGGDMDLDQLEALDKKLQQIKQRVSSAEALPPSQEVIVHAGED